MNDGTSKQSGRKRKQPVKPANQGEGDKQSARRFNQAQEAFVQSERGQAAIERDAEPATAGEREALEHAEREGKARAKGEDPAVTRRP